jgi:hypothetical protein
MQGDEERGGDRLRVEEGEALGEGEKEGGWLAEKGKWKAGKEEKADLYDWINGSAAAFIERESWSVRIVDAFGFGA